MICFLPGAIVEYTKAIEACPTMFKAYFNRGFAYDKLSVSTVPLGVVPRVRRFFS